MSTTLENARDHARAGRLDEARKIAQDFLDAQPQSAEILQFLADIEIQHGNLQRAADLLTRAADALPGNKGILTNLSIVYAKLGQADLALSTLVRLADVAGDDADLHFKIGAGIFGRAEKQFDGRASTEAAPADLRNELLAAKARFEKSLALNAQQPSALHGVILCQLGLNDVYQACLATLQYAQIQTQDKDLPENFKDMQLRLFLEKALRPPADAIPPKFEDLPPVGPRDAWDVQAIAEIARVIPQPLAQTTAVFFHVDIGDKHPFLRGGDRDPSKRIDYLATMAMACRCARLTQPGVAIILVTDMDTKIDGFTDADYIIRLPRDPYHLMYARVRACNALVLSKRLQGPILFVDTDLCLNRDFAPLFDGSFDVALTYRSSMRFPLMPINEGLILGSPARPQAVAQFFKKYIDHYDWLAEQPNVKTRYGFDVRFWRGGQLSLGAFAGWRVPPNTAHDAEVNGLRCRFLHCESYNYSVPAAKLPPLDHIWGLHFKGMLPKALMNQHLANLEARYSKI